MAVQWRHLGSSTRAGAFRRHRAQAHAWPSANPSPRGASGRSGGSMPMSVPATPAYASLRALTSGPPAPASSWLISRREVAAPRLPAAAGGLGRARGMLQCVCPVLHTDCCLHATSIRLLGSIRCDSKVQLLSAGRCLEADDLGFEMEQWGEWDACEPFHGAQGTAHLHIESRVVAMTASAAHLTSRQRLQTTAATSLRLWWRTKSRAPVGLQFLVHHAQQCKIVPLSCILQLERYIDGSLVSNRLPLRAALRLWQVVTEQHRLTYGAQTLVDLVCCSGTAPWGWALLVSINVQTCLAGLGSVRQRKEVEEVPTK